MNKTSKGVLFVIVLFTLMISVLTTTASANSAEPPALVILVNNPPDDFSIVLESKENQREANVRRVAWEGYYAFYSRDLQADGEYRFKVTANGKSLECTLGPPLIFG